MHPAIPPSAQAMSSADKIRDLAKTILTFLFCAGFVAYGLAVMFLMPGTT